MDIEEATANMIIDIGGGTTDIAVLSLNGIVLASSIKISGDTFDHDIVKYIREKYKLLIGEKTAENIKINFANIYKADKKLKFEVKGRDLITGLPSIIEVNQAEIKDALSKSAEKIVQEVINVLEQTPPELSADIVDKGILLTGGGSQLKGLPDLLKEKLNVPILLATSPMTSVADGTGILLEKIKDLNEN